MWNDKVTFVKTSVARLSHSPGVREQIPMLHYCSPLKDRQTFFPLQIRVSKPNVTWPVITWDINKHECVTAVQSLLSALIPVLFWARIANVQRFKTRLLSRLEIVLAFLLVWNVLPGSWLFSRLWKKLCFYRSSSWNPLWQRCSHLKVPPSRTTTEHFKFSWNSKQLFNIVPSQIGSTVWSTLCWSSWVTSTTANTFKMHHTSTWSEQTWQQLSDLT